MEEEKVKYTDIIDIKLENKKIKTVLDIALNENDGSWNIHDTNHDDNIKIAYKQISDNDDIYTVKAEMMIDVKDDNGDPLDIYYKYNECGYNDYYGEKLKNNNSTSDAFIHKFIDNNHQICYSAVKSGYDWIIASRDFVYIKTRFIKKDYIYLQTKYEKIVGGLAYSVFFPNDSLFNIKTKKDHYRGNIIYHSYILSQTKQEKINNKIKLTRIFALDPCGLIPKWFVNIILPTKGMDIKKFEKNWKKIKEIMEKRKKNNFKKDHEPLFPEK